MSKDLSSSISVVVRIRPLNENENTLIKQNQQDVIDSAGSFKTKPKPHTGYRKIVHSINNTTLLFDPPERPSFGGNVSNSRFSQFCLGQRRNKNLTFSYDNVLDQSASQQRVFDATTKDLVHDVLKGYNATIFAYGATGCGKTHTILGNHEDPGIVYLGMELLFKLIEEEKETINTSITLSYLEVYNENLKDLLLAEGSKPQPLTIRDNNGKSVTVSGLSEHNPKNVREVMDMVSRGNSRRATCATAANAVSSRSHAVLQINISRRPKSSAEFSKYTAAVLNIIDLAGSERASSTRNFGARLREALGSCINALAKGTKQGYIPYRESKLTRLLKFSLDGNCKTVMIVCISPSSVYYEETYNTLNYAFRAKNIKNTLVSNNNVEMTLPQCLRIIESLKKELEIYKTSSLNKPQNCRNEGFDKDKIAILEDYKNRVFENFKEKEEKIKQKITLDEQVEKLRIKSRLLDIWISEAKHCEKYEKYDIYTKANDMYKETIKKLCSLNKEKESLSIKSKLAEDNVNKMIENFKIEIKNKLGEKYMELYIRLINEKINSFETEKLKMICQRKSENISYILNSIPNLIQINPSCLLELKPQPELFKSPRPKSSVLEKIHRASTDSFMKTFSLKNESNNDKTNNLKSPKLKSCLSRNLKEHSKNIKKQVSFDTKSPMKIKLISPVKNAENNYQPKQIVSKRSSAFILETEKRMKARRTSLTNLPSRIFASKRASLPPKPNKLFSRK